MLTVEAMQIRRAIVLLAVLGTSPLGCEDTSGDSGAASAGEMWCGAVCAAVERCEGPAPECSDRCLEANPWLGSLSTSGAERLRPCVAQLSCAAVRGNDEAWKAENDACWEQAKAAAEPSAETRAFCSDYCGAEFQCGYWLSTTECEARFSMWTAYVLANVSVCNSQPSCEDHEACVQRVFDNL